MLKDSDLSLIERAFILDGLQAKARLDGRALDQLRPVSIEFGDEFGNVSVRLGKTRFVPFHLVSILASTSEAGGTGVL